MKRPAVHSPSVKLEHKLQHLRNYVNHESDPFPRIPGDRFGRCLWIFQREFVDSSWLYRKRRIWILYVSCIWMVQSTLFGAPDSPEYVVRSNTSDSNCIFGKKEQFGCSVFDAFEQQGQPINRPDYNIDMWLLFVCWWHADTGQTW